MGTIALGGLEIGSLLIGYIGAKILPKVVTADEATAGPAQRLREKIAELRALIAKNLHKETPEVISGANAAIAAAEAALAA